MYFFLVPHHLPSFYLASQGLAGWGAGGTVFALLQSRGLHSKIYDIGKSKISNKREDM